MRGRTVAERPPVRLADLPAQKRFVIALGAQLPVPHEGKLFVLAFQRRERQEMLFFVTKARIPLDADVIVAPVPRQNAIRPQSALTCPRRSPGGCGDRDSGP
jgi:hypothetical protein